MNYNVFDSGNRKIATFKSYENAVGFKMLAGRPDWTIKKQQIKEQQIKRKSTSRQRAALAFCEEMLNINYIGDREDFYEVSEFLTEYLDEAKSLYTELQCEFESYYNDLLD